MMGNETSTEQEITDIIYEIHYKESCCNIDIHELQLWNGTVWVHVRTCKCSKQYTNSWKRSKNDAKHEDGVIVHKHSYCKYYSKKIGSSNYTAEEVCYCGVKQSLQR